MRKSVKLGWPDRTPAEGLLRAASWVYRGAVAARDAGFRRGILQGERVPACVVSVGNLATGGTGKTPLVALVAGQLAAMGRRVAILTRGYGRTERGLCALGPGDRAGDWRRIGDEPALLRQRLPGVPMVIAADRVAAAREAIRRFGAETLILDDGFQHRWLARDVDVVLLDALRPFDNGHLLPRGLLREPPAALSRAHLVVLTAEAAGADWAAAVARLAPWSCGAPAAGAVRVPICWLDLASDARVAPEGFAGRRVVAFAGIARPDPFKALVEHLGMAVAAFLPFRDHHPYTPGDVGSIVAAARRQGADFAVTTEKDAVRLASLPAPEGLSIKVLRIGMQVVWGAAAFWARVAGAPHPAQG